MRCILYSDQTHKSTEAQFPTTGLGLQTICDELGIPNTAATEVTVTKAKTELAGVKEEIFRGKKLILDELNFLTKQLDLFDQTELELFSGFASQNANTSRELMVVAEMVDRRTFLTDENDWQNIRHGTCLPSFFDDAHTISVELMVLGREVGSNCEFLGLPYHESELRKSLERLGLTEQSEFADVEVEFHDLDFFGSLRGFLIDQELTVDNLVHLNEIATLTENYTGFQGFKLGEIAELTQIKTLAELATLAKALDDVRFLENVDSPQQLGEHFLEKALQNDCFSDAHPFIDYEGYGRLKLESVNYLFTDDGLLAYKGTDPKMVEIIQNLEQMKLEMGGMT